MRNRPFKSLAIIAAALLATSVVNAQEKDDADIDALDLTMKLMPAGATVPDAVTGIIQLPAAAPGSANDDAERGLDQANSARERREDGLDNAEAAAAEGETQAEQNREDLGRDRPAAEDIAPPAGAPGDLPGNAPDSAGPPATPGPPGN